MKKFILTFLGLCILAISFLANATDSTGMVKFYNPYKTFNGEQGVGYITPDTETFDFYFHTADIHPDSLEILRHGCEITFDKSNYTSNGERRVTNIQVVSCPVD